MFPGFTWARAKGKNNYACNDKASTVFYQRLLVEPEMERLKNWYESTKTGDKDEIPFDLSSSQWEAVNVDDSCIGRKCRYAQDGSCHWYNAKNKLDTAQFIVTNFDLALIQLLNPDAEILPWFKVLVFDEAHELEDKMISKLERSMGERYVLGSIMTAGKHYDCGQYVDATNPQMSFVNQTHLAATLLFQEYSKFLGFGEEKKKIAETEEVKRLTADFQFQLERLIKRVTDYDVEPDTREEKRKQNYIDRLWSIYDTAGSITDHNANEVCWVERDGKAVKVVTSPFMVADTINDVVFENGGRFTVITLSATLSAGGAGRKTLDASGNIIEASRFEQYRSRIGATQAAEYVCPSPFNYKRNCVLYLPKVPDDCLDPNSAAWRLWMLGQTIDLLKLSSGRAFVLTTSSKACNEIGEQLIALNQWPVKVQGRGMGNARMTEWFKTTPGGVLVGTASFWQGVSVEGDDLKLVIIDKIPFSQHQDPIAQAREGYYKNIPALAKRSFMDLQVYPATIKLRQGVGRLIRTKTDTGAVALLDPRLTIKPYGKAMLNTLPNATRVTDINNPLLVDILR